jgi:hypothetical protein
MECTKRRASDSTARGDAGLNEAERAAEAAETIKRRALNNQAVLRRKLKAASYSAVLAGDDAEDVKAVDWGKLFAQVTLGQRILWR